MAGEISAVHRRDILGFERAQIAGGVPVVEMAAESLEAIHRGERRVEALGHLVRAGPSEVVRGDYGEKIESEIGWRGAMGNNRLRVFLEVVGREQVVLGGDELLEKTPGAAGGKAERVRDVGGERLEALDRRRKTG